MIKRKKQIFGFLTQFERVADWDGEKYFLTLNTVKPKGTLTIMKYQDGNFTYHRKNELYWDIGEIKFENDQLQDIVWGFRKVINKMISENLVSIK